MHYIADKALVIDRSQLAGKFFRRVAKSLFFSVLLALSHAAWADFELTAPDGRRIQLKDDGSWKYKDPVSKDPSKAKPEGEAVLQFEKRIERGNHCRLVFSLTNNLTYEIQSLVPYLSVYRANGVMHESLSIAFQSIRPADKVERFADFSRITCPEIARVQVVGGDRCAMGALTKFSEANGQCLALVRLAPSSLGQFDK